MSNRGGAVTNRWPRELEGEGGIECVGGGVWRGQTLRSEDQLVQIMQRPFLQATADDFERITHELQATRTRL